jgi:hypothetical protein
MTRKVAKIKENLSTLEEIEDDEDEAVVIGKTSCTLDF